MLNELKTSSNINFMIFYFYDSLKNNSAKAEKVFTPTLKGGLFLTF